MSARENNIAVKIDASVFSKQVGDSVKQGEILGEFAGKTVTAPCDGIIEGASFEPEDHALIVVVRGESENSSLREGGDPHYEK
jgi:hypothetical protein